MADLDPARCAAEYAAGELSSAECLRFEELLRTDPSLAAEVAFWRDLRSGMGQGTAQKTTATGPDLAVALLRRAALERQHPPARRLRLPRWVAAAAVAAACLGLGFGFGAGAAWARPSEHAPRPEVSEIAAAGPVAYGEDGAGMSPPAATVAWNTWLPLAAIDQAEADRPLPMTPTVRPWIGLWTRPAKLVVAGQSPRATHLVVRVVADSPAWRAGLRPGDMVTAIDHCPIDGDFCLGEHLAHLAPGDSLNLEYWSAIDASDHSGTVVLTAVHE
jgi:hypothetical protein